MTNKSTILVSSAATAILVCSLSPCFASASGTSGGTWIVINQHLGSSSVTDQNQTCLTMDPATRRLYEFRSLVKSWKAARGTVSSVSSLILMPEYQRIIGMGESAVPLLIDQLVRENHDPDLWFWALTAITGEDPTKEEDQGNFPKMAKAWISWAQDQGYVV
jgi:hypothetical protein